MKPVLLLVNQTIGPLFSDVVSAAKNRGEVHVFKGAAYDRSTFFSRCFTWSFFSIQLAWHLIRCGQRYDRLLVVSNPPIAPLLAPFARRPYSLLLYDLYPQVLRQLHLPPFLLVPTIKLWHSLNKLVYANAERVFTLSTVMASELRPYFVNEALWSSKLTVIPPWSDKSVSRRSDQDRDLFRQQMGIPNGDLLITYAGNLGLTHPLEHLLHAASILHNNILNLPVCILIIGNGPKRSYLEQLSSYLMLTPSRLRFLDPLPFDHLPSLLSATDLTVVALDGPSASASLPSKTFSALACGAPLLALAPTNSSLASLVISHLCGLVIPPGPKASDHIVSAIVDLLANPFQLSEWSSHALASSHSYTSANADAIINAWLGESRS